MEIKLLKGLDNFEFGLSKDGFLEMNATKSKFDVIEEEEETKTEALYCEGDETEMILTSCETEYKDSMLFGIKIFDKKEDEVIKIMNDHGFSDIEKDIEEWGEKRISFFDAMTDFNFEEGRLVSLSWGILLM